MGSRPMHSLWDNGCRCAWCDRWRTLDLFKREIARPSARSFRESNYPPRPTGGSDGR